MKINSILAGLAVLLLTSCISSKGTITDLRNLSEDINTNGSNYTLGDWKKTADKYYTIDKRLIYFTSKGKYSNDDLKEIGELQGKCLSGFKSSVEDNAYEKIGGITNFLQGLVKGITNMNSTKE